MAEQIEDDVPPLEDMTHLLTQLDIKPQATKYIQSSVSTPPVSKPTTTKTDNYQLTKTDSDHLTTTKTNSDKPTNSAKSSSFGGMKKGFLFSSDSKSKSSTKTQNVPSSKTKPIPSSKTEPIPHIKANNQESPFKFDEVQEAMKANENLLQNREWLNDDLLKTIESNSVLYSKLSNPQFAQAIAEFQRNPQAAMLKYADNAEMQTFLKEFCGVVGDHFTGLADKKQNEKIADMAKDFNLNPDVMEALTPEEKDQIQHVLGLPHVKETLMDEDIKKLLESLKTNPLAGDKLLKEASGDMKRKINILLDAGLLNVQKGW